MVQRNSVSSPLKEERSNFIVPEPLEEVFLAERTSLGRLMPTASHQFYKIKRVEYKDGIHVWKEGWLYPTHGFVYPEAMEAVNIAKRLFKTLFAVITPLSWLRRDKIVCAFTRTVYGVVQPHLLKDEYWTPFARELKNIIFKETNNLMFARVIACIFEYDDAYRWRVQDILTELDVARFNRRPRLELQRLLHLFLQRETIDELKHQAKRIYNLLLWLLPLFSFKFKRILKECDLKSLRFDLADEYNTLFQGEYNYGGLDWAGKQHHLYKLHQGKLPQAYNIRLK